MHLVEYNTTISAHENVSVKLSVSRALYITHVIYGICKPPSLPSLCFPDILQVEVQYYRDITATYLYWQTLRPIFSVSVFTSYCNTILLTSVTVDNIYGFPTNNDTRIFKTTHNIGRAAPLVVRFLLFLLRQTF